MKTILKSLSFIIILAWVGCKHDNSLTEPTLQDTFGEFGIDDSLTASKYAVGFATGDTVSFKARFTIRTKWKLSIIGKKSKVIKTITGSSKVLDATNAVWDGSSDVPVFPADSAFVTLTFPDDTTRGTMKIKLNVTSPKNFASNPNYIPVKDFTNGMKGASFNNDNGNCTKFGIDTLLGGVYFNAEGMENSATSYYMGGLAITTGAEHASTVKYFPVVFGGAVADSDQVANTYFNLWVYGYGNPITKLTVQFNESDKGNTDFINQPAKDDTWEYAIYPIWNGWQQVSFPMNKTVPSLSAAYGGSGNKRREIDRIVSITINTATEKSATGVFVQTTYTYPIFSVGAPFNY